MEQSNEFDVWTTGELKSLTNIDPYDRGKTGASYGWNRTMVVGSNGIPSNGSNRPYLYANWKPKTAKILYKCPSPPNKPSGYYDEVQTTSTGEKVKIQALVANQASWSTSKNLLKDGGYSYFPGDTVPIPPGNTVLYPKSWKDVCANGEGNKLYRLDKPYPVVMNGDYDGGKGGTVITKEYKDCETVREYFNEYIDYGYCQIKMGLLPKTKNTRFKE